MIRALSIFPHLIRENHCPPPASFISLLYLPTLKLASNMRDFVLATLPQWGKVLDELPATPEKIPALFFAHGRTFSIPRVFLFMRFTCSHAFQTDPMLIWPKEQRPAPVQRIARGTSLDLMVHLLNYCKILKRPSNPNTIRKPSLSSARSRRPTVKHSVNV